MRNILYKQARRETFLNALEKTALLETLKSMGTTLAAPFKAVAPAAHAVTGAIANPATVHATENAAQTAAQTPAGHGFMNAIKGYGRENGRPDKRLHCKTLWLSLKSHPDI